MSSTKADGDVYRIKHTRDDIVDDILDILDGPEPMTHMKPDKLKPNSADQFKQAQDEYEARGKRSTDYIEQVRRHNSTYPQLKDELNKRRSLMKVTMNKGNAERNVPDLCAKRRQELKMKSKMKRIGNRQNQRLKSTTYSRRNKCTDKNCRCRRTPAINKIVGGKSKREDLSKLLLIMDEAEIDSREDESASSETI